MKVMCIEMPERRYCPSTGEDIDDKLLQVGEIYTVVKTFRHHVYHLPLYILEEFTHNEWFGVDLFAPLSDIDETELVNEKIEAI